MLRDSGGPVACDDESDPDNSNTKGESISTVDVRVCRVHATGWGLYCLAQAQFRIERRSSDLIKIATTSLCFECAIISLVPTPRGGDPLRCAQN